MKKIILMVFIVVLLSGCDHTDLRGDVLILTEELQVGTLIPLYLDVTDDLSEIYNVMWSLDYKDKEEAVDLLIIEGEDLLDYYEEDFLLSLFDQSRLNYDRIAIFIPSMSGQYHLEVSGYYKQTNPQPITSLEVTIE